MARTLHAAPSGRRIVIRCLSVASRRPSIGCNRHVPAKASLSPVRAVDPSARYVSYHYNLTELNMKIIVFYSWQSDSPAKTNLEFISESLELALQNINENNQQDIEFEIDRDTKGVSGTPAVADTVLNKIAKSNLFVCDLTIISEKSVKKPTPNPNFLFELGYAVSTLGWDKIIGIMNSFYGEPSKLPFDFKHRRWPISYSISQNATEQKRNHEKIDLSDKLELAIRHPIENGIIFNKINPKDKRVAETFEHVLNLHTMSFTSFASSHGYEKAFHLLREEFDDENGKKYPSPKILDEFMIVLLKTNLINPSTAKYGDKNLNWIEYFQIDLHNIILKCNKILDRYADRDDSLISLVEEISNRADSLSKIIELSYNAESGPNKYSEGIPPNYIEQFRYFFLTVSKSFRTVREFKH
jgi:hypothetical protein